MNKFLLSAFLAVTLFITPAQAKRSGPDPHSIANQIAHIEGVSSALVHAVIHVESTSRCNIGGGGAMQVNRRTAASVGVHGDLRNCRTGILAGVRYLKWALKANHGNVCAAATSYNSGRVNGSCSHYGRKILSHIGRRHH